MADSADVERATSHSRRRLLVVVLLLTAALVIGGTRLAVWDDAWLPWSKTGGEVTSGLGSEILVMRTPGGLLEVSRITATE